MKNGMDSSGSIKQVITGGFCSGCGACAYANGARMGLNQYGEYVPEHNDAADDERVITSCPFLRPELNEDVLAEERFGQDAIHDPSIGYYLSCYGAYVTESSFRESGTSGGMGTWIGVELMRRGLIDGVIHAKAVERKDTSDPFFRYGISRSEDEVRTNSRTRYHVMEMSQVITEVREREGRYLFIGVPCFAKAVRRLQKIDPIIAERISYVVALVCGHYKSVNWTLSLGWGAGVAPKDLAKFQYRTKGPDIPARAYVYRATAKDGSVVQKDTAEVVGGKFNAGAMMLSACDYCDDVVGETADLTVGDAWLPKFDVNQGGTNLLIVRNAKIATILNESCEAGRIYLDAITAKEAADSQSGGFRQRREGLSYRLLKAGKEGVWTPQKRVDAGSIPASRTRQKIYDARMACSKSSREAFVKSLEGNDYTYYVDAMNVAFKRLRRIEIRSSFFRILRGRIERIFRKLKS